MTNERCPFCGVGTRGPGETSVTLTRDGATVVIHHVPANVCPACGEATIAADVVDAVHAMGERVLAAGARCQALDYIGKVA